MANHTFIISKLLIKVLHLIDSIIVAIILYFWIKYFNVQWTIYYLNLTICSMIITFICFYSAGLYRPWRGIRLFKELIVILKAWAFYVFTLLFVLFAFKISEQYSRSVMLSWICFTPLFIFIMHLIARKCIGLIRQRGMNLKYAVIVGAGAVGQNIAKNLIALPWAGIKVVGYFDDQPGYVADLDWPVLGSVEQLSGYLRSNQIDYVFIALPLWDDSLIRFILYECRAYGAHILMVPDLIAYNIFNSEFQPLGEMVLINFNPVYNWKRHFDILFSLVIIIITLPITLTIALLIKTLEGGPVFYGHERVTMAGKTFKCWKFRTMVLDADKILLEILKKDPEAKKEWEGTFKLKKDPRMTKIGKYLRRFSLDELPQFINVLTGDMSVVGARPVVPQELEKYYKENAGAYCSTLPGITGPWQVDRRNNINDYDERVERDMWYFQNVSMWLDIKIIYRTILCVLKGKGA